MVGCHYHVQKVKHSLTISLMPAYKLCLYSTELLPPLSYQPTSCVLLLPLLLKLGQKALLWYLYRLILHYVHTMPISLYQPILTCQSAYISLSRHANQPISAYLTCQSAYPDIQNQHILICQSAYPDMPISLSWHINQHILTYQSAYSDISISLSWLANQPILTYKISISWYVNQPIMPCHSAYPDISISLSWHINQSILTCQSAYHA